MESLAPENYAHKWVLDKGEVALLGYFGSDRMIADTARVSYRKGTKQQSSDKQLMRYLMRNRHTSPFEHVCLRFYIKAPLFVIQQLLRHRTFKFNQCSARYSEMLEEAYQPMPEHITTQDAKNKQARTDKQINEAQAAATWIELHNKKAFEEYHDLLGAGAAREIARTVVPHGAYSEIIVTCDLHNLMHFLGLRLNPHAQYEIRVFAEAMYEMAKGLFPDSFEAWDDCVLKSFTLTGQMHEVLAMAINMSSCYDDWGVCVEDASNKFTWASSSERDQFINWCITRLKL